MLTDKKILIVDDEKGLLDILRLTLHKEGFINVVCAENASEAFKLVRESHFNLLLLDVMLPDFSGFDLCQEIRKFSYVPIIFITALDTDFNQLTGLAIGGDDYITKPLKPLLIVSKVRAILRRQEYSSDKKFFEPYVYRYPRFVLNLSDGTLNVNGAPVTCTAKELELLRFFCENPNRVFPQVKYMKQCGAVTAWGMIKPSLPIYLPYAGSLTITRSNPQSLSTNAGLVINLPRRLTEGHYENQSQIYIFIFVWDISYFFCCRVGY